MSNQFLAPYKDLIASIISKKCYVSLVEKFNYKDVDCLKLLISKVLGYGIVFSSAIVKLPQLSKILIAKSAQGVSFLSIFIETLAYSVTILYNKQFNNPFSTYGETIFLHLQNYLILCAILCYTSGGRAFPFLLLLALTFALCIVIVKPQVLDLTTLTLLQGFSIPASIASKLPQVYSNYKNGSTGQLSAITIFMYAAGSTARIFTTLQEVDDMIILSGFIAATALNYVLALQMALYWNVKAKKE